MHKKILHNLTVFWWKASKPIKNSCKDCRNLICKNCALCLWYEPMVDARMFVFQQRLLSLESVVCCVCDVWDVLLAYRYRNVHQRYCFGEHKAAIIPTDLKWDLGPKWWWVCTPKIERQHGFVFKQRLLWHVCWNCRIHTCYLHREH